METYNKATLLDLVRTISDYAINDDEIVATVAYLVNSGQVVLCGTFVGAKIDLSTPVRVASHSPTSLSPPPCKV